MRKSCMAFILAGLMWQSLPVLIGAESGILFQESFRNYRDKLPACADDIGIRIGNDPIAFELFLQHRKLIVRHL